jgi:hypothetical protein
MSLRGPDARTVAQMLGARAAELAAELLPHGKREGHEWVAPSIAGTSNRSTSVHLTGSKAGLWADFSSNLRGDGLDLVAAILFGSDKKAAYKWALAWLGFRPGGPPPAIVARPRPAPAPNDAHDSATRAAAQRLFLSGQASLADTPAAAYLAGRGLDLAQLGRQPRSLRYHPNCLCTETGGHLPAMLAAVCGPDGKFLACHRTWLAESGGAWRKAALRSPKKVLGGFGGGVIRLWRGASGKPLATAPETDTVAIGEGIETCLSVCIAAPEYRVLAAVSLSNLARITLPAQLIDVVILADNDQGNASAEAALQRAVDRLLAEGRSVRVARSSVGKDFNDGINCA